MRIYYTCVPDRDDDLKSGDEVNELLEDGLEHCKQAMILGGRVLYKFTNMPPIEREDVDEE